MPTRDKAHIIRQRKAAWRMAGLAAIIFAFTLMGRIMHDQKEAQLALVQGEPELRTVQGTRNLSAGHVEEGPVSAPGETVWFEITSEKQSPAGEGAVPTAVSEAEAILGQAKEAIATCLDRWWMLAPDLPTEIGFGLEFTAPATARMRVSDVAVLPPTIEACLTHGVAPLLGATLVTGVADLVVAVPASE